VSASQDRELYYAVPYLRGCGELIVKNTDVKFIGDFVVITVTAYRPEDPEEVSPHP
jgi:hypothetical protein